MAAAKALGKPFIVEEVCSRRLSADPCFSDLTLHLVPRLTLSLSVHEHTFITTEFSKM